LKEKRVQGARGFNFKVVFNRSENFNISATDPVLVRRLGRQKIAWGVDDYADRRIFGAPTGPTEDLYAAPTGSTEDISKAPTGISLLPCDPGNGRLTLGVGSAENFLGPPTGAG